MQNENFFPVAVLSGDYPDPSIVRVGQDYYMTHSTCMYGPGLLIWHSTNLMDWSPLSYALNTYLGDVWAPELVYINHLFYIYFPANGTNYVIYSDKAEGPWSDPIDLGIEGIDPGHVMGKDGNRYLHVNFGRVVQLAPDGLSVSGELVEVYDGWPIPEEWATEGKALESPKLVFKDGYYYMVCAQGGTAGPATSHMAIVARSQNPIGPWENSPYNPLVHTWSNKERWWSKGHATLFDTFEGQWYVVYHAYEKDYYNLGRQTLIEPIFWTEDGWPILSQLNNSIESTLVKQQNLSDDFQTEELAWQWRFYKELDKERYKTGNGMLRLRAKGESPADSSPLLCIPTHHVYEAEVQIKVDPNTEAGLVLFYNEHCYAGIGFTDQHIFRLRRGMKNYFLPGEGCSLHLKLRNEHHMVTMFYSADGNEWIKFPAAIDVSAYHHNAFGDFISLRLGVYAAGDGSAEFMEFRYRSLS